MKLPNTSPPKRGFENKVRRLENPHRQNQEFSRPPWIILILLNIQIFIGKLCPMCEDKWCWCAVTVHQRTLYSAVQYSTVQDHNNNISALCCQNQ